MSTNPSPKISVIIPLYNQKTFVGQAVTSILDQTYEPVEIIVIDDGSTDNPESILEPYLEKIIFIKQCNKGLSAARNSGITHASGEYLQFLDADDFLHKDKIRLQLDFMLGEKSSISYCEVVQYDSGSGKGALRFIGDTVDIFKHLFNMWYPYPLPIHSLLFHKRVFKEYGNFPEYLFAAEDRYLLSIMALGGERFAYFPFIGGYRRRHETNMNHDRLHIYKNMLVYYEHINQLETARKQIKEWFGLPSRQLMGANFAYMLLRDIEAGTPKTVISEVRRFLSHRGVKLNFIGIQFPGGHRHAPLLIGKAYMRRWIRWIAGKLRARRL